jgi:hypothetical protein
MFKITDWDKRYEVSIKGREPKEGEELRAGPLQYIRLKVYGHKQGAGFRKLKRAAGQKTMEVFGIFCKLLEISGDQSRGKRGDLLNEKDQPATIQDLAFIIDVPEKQIENALKILTSKNVGWLITNTTQPTNQESGKLPETPGESGKPALLSNNGSFDIFWQNYPKKVGKGEALKKWKKIKPSGVLLSKMLFTLAWQVKSDQWKKDKGQFIPNPATWLNQERWNDEPIKTGGKTLEQYRAEREAEDG